MFSESSFLASILNYLHDPQGSVPYNYTDNLLDLLVAMYCNWCSMQLLMHVNHVLLVHSAHQQTTMKSLWPGMEKLPRAQYLINF